MTIQNDEAGRPMPEAFKDPHHLANTADAMGRLCKSWQGSTAEYHFACRDTIRAQAARIAELEGLVAADFDMLDSTWKARAEAAEAEVARLTAELEAARAGLNTAWADRDMHCRRAEKAEAALSEMTRRRDEWRKKAEGYDAVRLALREKVGTPWPANMSRLLWAGIAADEKKRADDAEAEVARLREALPTERVKHIKRGTTYQIIARGKLQTDTPLSEYAELVAYRCEETGDVWFRPKAEFTPDRFAALQPKQED